VPMAATWSLVPPRALAGLARYKYGAEDHSPLTKYLMKPYWDWAVTLFPLWMAYAARGHTHAGGGGGGSAGAHWWRVTVAVPCLCACVSLSGCRPNLITLIGFGFVVANLVCVAWLLPGLEGQRPFWLALRYEE
jgi:hypothetical protein